MLHSYPLIAVAAVAAVGFGLAAEDKETTTKTKETVSAVGVISPQENDRRIARWLVVDNESMRSCAALVEDHSSNVRVKEMARTIAADHKRFDARLNAFTSAAPETPQAPNAAKTATLLKDDGRSRDNRLTFQPTDFLAVKESVCKNLRSKAEEEFKALKGTEFDDAFLAHMVIGHEALIANIDAVRTGASEQLQTTLDEFRDLSLQHLKNVRNLRKAQHPETANR